MTFDVFQRVNPTFFPMRVDEVEAAFADPMRVTMFARVATVECDDIERVFQLTNTIDSYWWENPEVTPQVPGAGCRSTSIGDVIRDVQTGTLYQIAYVGLQKIS